MTVTVPLESPPVTGSGETFGADRLAALLPEVTAADVQAGIQSLVERALTPTVFLVSALVDETSTNVLAEPMPADAVFAGHSTGAGVLVARSRPGEWRRAVGIHSLDARSTAELVRDLWERSGLTWDQLARLFGVSRRAMHAWATGKRPNAYHQELLTELTQVVAQIDTGDPPRNRDQLLAPRPQGRSLFDELRARRADPSSDITGTLPPAQLLGALHDRGPSEGL